MADETVQGVDDGALANVASSLPRLPNLRADDPDRFAQAVRALLERRAQQGWPGELGTHDVAAFVLVARPREFQARFGSKPVTDPGATSEPLLGRVMLLTRDAANGQAFSMPCDPNALLDWLLDEGFGDAPVVLAYKPTAVMTVRHGGVVGGVSRDDQIRDVPPEATLDELRRALAQFHLRQLLTPAFCVDGVWESGRAGAYVPGAQPERSIQKGLAIALNSWFHGVVLAEVEDSTPVGRIDVRLLIAADDKPLTYWAIVELKVVKSFANAKGKVKPAQYKRPDNVAAIQKGLRQAWSYGANRKVRGLLEIYDLRNDKDDDLLNDEEVKATMTSLAPLPEYRMRPLYGSAEDARLAGATGA